MCAVLIVHTAETQDWATYLRLILEGSHHFHQDSISSYLLDEENPFQNEDYSIFYSCKCILLLVSVALIELHGEAEVQDTFEKVLQPPCKVVAFTCGVSENDGLVDYFEHWASWQKLDSDDEPSKYVSTVLEVISNEDVTESEEDEQQDQLRTDYEIPPLKQRTGPSASKYQTVSDYDQSASEYAQSASKYDETASEYAQSASKYDQSASECDLSDSENGQSALKYDQTASEYAQAASEYDNSVFKYNHSASEYDQSTSEYAQSASEYDNTVFKYNHSASEYDQSTSEYAQSGSKYDQTASEYIQSPLKYDQTASEYIQSPSKYDQTASEYIQSPSKYDQTASEYIQSPSKYDQTASEYIQSPSKYDQTSSEYIQSPSRYDQTASEYAQSASKSDQSASNYDQSTSESPEESDRIQPVAENPHVSDENPTQPASPNAVSSDQQNCLSIQPQRILCGTRVDIYLIMLKKLDNQANVEVEFHCEHSTKRVTAVPVNEYIVRAQSPDMPAGDVSLHLYMNESFLCSTTVTYYTEMEEISRYLERVMDPVQFMCQAFNITSNASEALDDLFTNSLKDQMPAKELQVFGVGQLEQENTLANQRNLELPTLLHFSAKYGLKKLTTLLLQCPGALQAYSVVNKNGDYPNTLAEKSGFSDLRHFMDNYVETVDLVKSHMEESVENEESTDIYEPMANASQKFVAKYSLQEDIYESMMELNPEMQLYEDQESHNPQEALLRKFFEVKPEEYSETPHEELDGNGYPETNVFDTEEEIIDIYGEEEEEDPYNICEPEGIYDTVDDQDNPAVLNRPPAPIPRPATVSETEECKTYISTVFCSKDSLYSTSSHGRKERSDASGWSVKSDSSSTAHDPYAGMKTPGQRQLICLQERVKVGELTVEEAVQEFKAWQFNQDKRAQSVRFQQQNLQRLRDSIIRRHKERGRSGKAEDLEITAPMQRSLQWGTHMNVECSVYEPSPRSVAQPPPVCRPPQRGTWQTGSASSTSSSSSNRLSTLSTISYSSGADGELEEPQEIAPPPRPRRPEAPPTLPPPRVPPRIPERFPESMLNERYVSSPARALPHPPPNRPIPPPPVPRRPW